MKRLFLALALTLLVASHLWGQAGLPTGNIPSVLVANLPSSPAIGTLYVVTDANGASCATGSSTTKNLCRFNGAAWDLVSGAAGGTVYPGVGVANSTGSGWGTSFTVGTALNNLVQLNGSAQLPAVSGALLTNLACAGLPALTGDVTTPSGSCATTLAKIIPLSQLNGGSVPAAQSYNFSGATLLQLRNGAALTTTVNGDFAFDTTNSNWHGWNGADLIFAPLASGFASGDCGQPTSVAGKWTIADTGAPCGAGSGGLSGMTAGQIPVAATASTVASSVAESGTGNVCMTTNCVMTTPNLGTPSVLVLTNATGAPTWNQNTTGTAANLSGTPALPNGTSVTTQPVGNNTTDAASTAFVLANAVTNPANTLGDILFENATPVLARLAGCTLAVGVPCTLTSTPTSGPTAAAPVWGLPGVPVNNNSETTCVTQTLNILDRSTVIFCSGGTTSTFTFPVHTTTGFGANFPVFLVNNNSGTMTITPTTDTIDNGTLLSKWVSLTYNNSSGNWQTMQVPQFAAFGTTCANALTWSTTTGFGCSGAIGGTPTYPLTVAGTVTSGGIPYFNSTTQSSSSALLAANSVVLGGGAGTAPFTSSQLTFVAPTLTVGLAGTSTGVLALTGITSGSVTFTAPAVAGTTTNAITVSNNLTAPAFVANGTTAGFIDYPQGTTSTAVAPCNAATSICEQAPTAVTSYLTTKPGSAPNIASYKQTDGCAAASCTESFHPVPVLLTVTTDFTDSTSTTLQLITGLSTTMPVSKAVVISFHCSLIYDQATAAVSDSFGIGITGTAPTQANASGTAYTSTSALTTGTLTALASTTPTVVVTFSPSAITTIWKAELDGTVEQPSNATPGVFGVYAATTTGTDNFIVKRGSYCMVMYQ